jgi:uncharacterized membrane protein YgcG
MRITGLLGLVLATLTAALLLAAPTAAEPPFRLPGSITDHADALTGSQRGAVQSALDKLYADRRVRLWVVYVDSFSGQTGESWSRNTQQLSDLGGYDALLAVAIGDRSYGFLVSSAITNAAQVDKLRRDAIEPALGRGDWSAAALAAASGLARSGPTGGPGQSARG